MKHLCRSVKDRILENDLNQYLQYIKKPKYVCLTCGRAAKKEEVLCKSFKIK
jgi:hypothetical protein